MLLVMEIQAFENKYIHIVDSALHINIAQDVVAAVLILTPNNLMLWDSQYFLNTFWEFLDLGLSSSGLLFYILSLRI